MKVIVITQSIGSRAHARLDIVEIWQGHRLPLDVNVAAVRDPSHQYIGTD